MIALVIVAPVSVPVRLPDDAWVNSTLTKLLVNVPPLTVTVRVPAESVWARIPLTRLVVKFVVPIDAVIVAVPSAMSTRPLLEVAALSWMLEPETVSDVSVPVLLITATLCRADPDTFRLLKLAVPTRPWNRMPSSAPLSLPLLETTRFASVAPVTRPPAAPFPPWMPLPRLLVTVIQLSEGAVVPMSSMPLPAVSRTVPPVPAEPVPVTWKLPAAPVWLTKIPLTGATSSPSTFTDWKVTSDAPMPVFEMFTPTPRVVTIVFTAPFALTVPPLTATKAGSDVGDQREAARQVDGRPVVVVEVDATAEVVGVGDGAGEGDRPAGAVGDVDRQAGAVVDRARVADVAAAEVDVDLGAGVAGQRPARGRERPDADVVDVDADRATARRDLVERHVRRIHRVRRCRGERDSGPGRRDVGVAAVVDRHVLRRVDVQRDRGAGRAQVDVVDASASRGCRRGRCRPPATRSR